MRRVASEERLLIEPDPPGSDPGRLPRLLLAVLLGFVGFPLLLLLPGNAVESAAVGAGEMLDRAITFGQAQSYLTVIGAVAGLAVFLLIFRQVLAFFVFSLPVLAGLILGGFLWVPFGNHVYTLLPELQEVRPDLKPRIDRFVTDSDRLAGVRTWSEGVVPLPTGVRTR